MPIGTPRIATSTRTVGNSVTFRVAAKPGATVNIYRNGVLVSSVPASVAAAIKVSDNPPGENSYQVVVVEQSGKISISEKKIVVTSVSTNASSKSKVTPKKSAAKTPQSKASTTKNSK
jgi:hypothetical protein